MESFRLMRGNVNIKKLLNFVRINAEYSRIYLNFCCMYDTIWYNFNSNWFKAIKHELIIQGSPCLKIKFTSSNKCSL